LGKAASEPKTGPGILEIRNTLSDHLALTFSPGACGMDETI